MLRRWKHPTFSLTEEPAWVPTPNVKEGSIELLNSVPIALIDVGMLAKILCGQIGVIKANQLWAAETSGARLERQPAYLPTGILEA